MVRRSVLHVQQHGENKFQIVAVVNNIVDC